MEIRGVIAEKKLQPKAHVPTAQQKLLFGLLLFVLLTNTNKIVSL